MENYFKSDPNKIVRNPVMSFFNIQIAIFEVLTTRNEYALFSDV